MPTGSYGGAKVYLEGQDSTDANNPNWVGGSAMAAASVETITEIGCAGSCAFPQNPVDENLAEQRLAKADIQERQPGTVSVMPAGLDTQLSRQELADLMAFLQNTKWGAN